MTREEREVYDDTDFSMWMSLIEAVSYFRTLTVCRVRDWQEVRLPGKFVRVQDSDLEVDYEAVLSKWYY